MKSDDKGNTKDKIDKKKDEKEEEIKKEENKEEIKKEENKEENKEEIKKDNYKNLRNVAKAPFSKKTIFIDEIDNKNNLKQNENNKIKKTKKNVAFSRQYAMINNNYKNHYKELINRIKDFMEKSEKNDLKEILDNKIQQEKNQGNK